MKTTTEGGGGLPLLDENENPIFNREGKSQILEKMFFDGRHLANCSFDDTFKTDVENDLTTVTVENSKSNDAEEFLNYDISLNEVEAVIQHLKRNKSPGPDEVYTEILQNAGEEFMKAIQRLFQKSWHTLKLSSIWKQAEVKFLRKSGKKSYHDLGAYPPISLTRYPCKCMERIVTTRLYNFVEHFRILDKEQEGFRRFRGTQDALL